MHSESTGEQASRLNRSGQPRLRKWAPRAHTGCATCSCNKCTSTGRTCDGLQIMIIRRPPMVSYVMQMPSAWDYLGGEPVENESFHFFRSVTTINLAGLFDFGFWSYRLLQMSHQYPALWHAIAALAWLHRDFATDNTPMTVSRTRDAQKAAFALKQYNKSMKSMRELMSRAHLTRVDKLAILSTCIMYIGVAILQSYHHQAFQHIGSVIKLFHHWKLGIQVDEDDIEMGMMTACITQLDSLARPHLPSKQPAIPWTDNTITLIPSDRPFRSLPEAYVSLEVHFNRMIQFFTSLQNPSTDLSRPEQISHALSIKQTCLDDFAHWDRRIAGYLAIAPHEKDNKALNLLYLRRSLARISLSLDASKGELAYDEFLPDYTNMVALAARIQAALSLLRQYPRRECACESQVALHTAEALTSLERRTCSAAPPGSCSIGPWVCANHRVARLELENHTDHEIHAHAWTGEDLARGWPGTTFRVHLW
ncbi:hypothetical protein BO70DRAFT_387242, partial [Aspergillus heteromorphus CBS 117.55]